VLYGYGLSTGPMEGLSLGGQEIGRLSATTVMLISRHEVCNGELKITTENKAQQLPHLTHKEPKRPTRR